MKNNESNCKVLQTDVAKADHVSQATPRETDSFFFETYNFVQGPPSEGRQYRSRRHRGSTYLAQR